MERAHGRATCMAIVGLWALSACAIQPRSDARAPMKEDRAATITRAPTGVVELLRYAERIRALPLKALQHEYLESEQQFATAPTPDTRMRLALLVSLPAAPFRNDARARQLLAEGPDGEAGYDELARWLLVTIDERRALEDVAEEERRGKQALRAKLDQLKAIEEDLDRRMQAPVINPR